MNSKVWYWASRALRSFVRLGEGRTPAAQSETDLANDSALPAVTVAAFSAPRPQTAEIITAAVFSERLGGWTTAYLHREATENEGIFVLTEETYNGLRVAKYRPDRSGTHAPLGPTEMSAAGLRPTVPPVVD